MTASLAGVARKLGGTVVGMQVLCPGPGHSPKDRSLSVRMSTMSDDGFVVFSHAGDDVGACRDHVRALLGLGRPSWQRRQPPAPVAVLKPSAPDEDEAAKIARAAAIWDEGRDPAGTVVEAYLASRGLVLPRQAAGEAIRFHPACPWRDEASGRTIRVPAMIAAMRSIATDDVTGVHRTRLTPDGRKVDRRMLGRASGAAIMLTPSSAVEAGLAIGEGIETTLAGMMMGWAPAWAMGSVGAIARFPLVVGLQSLILFAETGDNGASARAIDAAAKRYGDAGREVIVVTPKCVGDANDAIRERAA